MQLNLVVSLVDLCNIGSVFANVFARQSPCCCSISRFASPSVREIVASFPIGRDAPFLCTLTQSAFSSTGGADFVRPPKVQASLVQLQPVATSLRICALPNSAGRTNKKTTLLGGFFIGSPCWVSADKTIDNCFIKRCVTKHDFSS